jgi:uncharacterized protein (DUF1800 family)
MPRQTPDLPAADLAAAIALTRFGLGARPGEMTRVAADPRGWLLAQIRPEGAPQPGRAFAGTAGALEVYTAYLAAGRGLDEAAAQAARQQARRALTRETGAAFLDRIVLAATTEAGFAERWALFWANHFAVSATKFQAMAFLESYEREAIRPFVFGRFADLVFAAESHPAMLLYLDQAQSVGPGSPAGRRREAGLNENLAREILELHTVGPEAGYSQADVTEFARALTGWSIPLPGARGRGPAAGTPGARGFVFRAVTHEPGVRQVMGRSYSQTGLAQGRAILEDMANHPATARRLARKLAAHFVVDDPPETLVERLTAAWTATGGDLAAVARALVEAPEAWAPAPAKIKTPYEFVASTHRAFGTRPTDLASLQQVLAGLGQPAWAPPSPEGWPDTAADWAGPDALVKRLDWAKTAGEVLAADPARNPSAIAGGALGVRLGERTRQAVARAESRPEALTLFLMSPEFQRR